MVRPDYSQQNGDWCANLPERRQRSCALQRQAGEFALRSPARSSSIVASAEHTMEHSRWCLRSSRLAPRLTQC